MPDRDGGWWTISNIFLGATVLRVSLLVYGLLQDARSAVPYTDVDYCVFTDAARFVWHGQSPYARDTYRYSPLLAWILVPTAWTFGPGSIYFAWGKVLFAAADLAAGWLALRVLVGRGSSLRHSLQVVGSTWLLNPMVATISTRGSSEALLGVLVTLLLWAALQRRLVLAGALLGLSVHLKIYPFIYGAAILLQLDTPPHSGWMQYILVFPTRSRMTFILTSLTTFMLLNGLMYGLYGQEFVQHTYLHHLTRIDHRHNFSPYNTLLHLSSALGSRRGIEKLAFVPQLGLSLFIIPLVLARKDLGGTMLCQTWAFVTFNKVVTSQVSALPKLQMADC